MRQTDNPDQKVHYIHRISNAMRERIAGIFVLAAVIIIAGLILIQSHSSHLFDKRVDYSVYLNNAQGVSTETLIHISGIEVGRVSTIDITSENKIHVKFFVYETFQRLIRSDTTAEMNKLSLIGNAVIILMCIELMLNAVNITMVAFSSYIVPLMLTGQIFAVFVMVVAAAEVAVGLAIILAIYRGLTDIDASNINLMKW